jgi:hypothetical protein
MKTEKKPPSTSDIAEAIVHILQRRGRAMKVYDLWEESRFGSLYEYDFDVAMKSLQGAGRIHTTQREKVFFKFSSPPVTSTVLYVELGLLEKLASIRGIKSRERALLQIDRKGGPAGPVGKQGSHGRRRASGCRPKAPRKT